MHKDLKDPDDKYDVEYSEDAVIRLQDIKKDFESADKSNPFEENLRKLLDKFNEDEKEFFKQKLESLTDEYAGIDIDLTKYEGNLADIRKINRIVRKYIKAEQ